jgi:hypothetical protein
VLGELEEVARGRHVFEEGDLVYGAAIMPTKQLYLLHNKARGERMTLSSFPSPLSLLPS